MTMGFQQDKFFKKKNQFNILCTVYYEHLGIPMTYHVVDLSFIFFNKPTILVYENPSRLICYVNNAAISIVNQSTE